MTTTTTTTKHTAVLEAAVKRANNAMSPIHREVGFEWSMASDSIIIWNNSQADFVSRHYGHFDVIDYRDDHVILVWADSEGQQIDQDSLVDLSADGADERLDRVLGSIQLPDLA